MPNISKAYRRISSPSVRRSGRRHSIPCLVGSELCQCVSKLIHSMLFHCLSFSRLICAVPSRCCAYRRLSIASQSIAFPLQLKANPLLVDSGRIPRCAPLCVSALIRLSAKCRCSPAPQCYSNASPSFSVANLSHAEATHYRAFPLPCISDPFRLSALPLQCSAPVLYARSPPLHAALGHHCSSTS